MWYGDLLDDVGMFGGKAKGPIGVRAGESAYCERSVLEDVSCDACVPKIYETGLFSMCLQSVCFCANSVL